MPTAKQALTLQKIVENRGMAVSRAMMLSGYKKATARNPKNLTQSKGWAQLLAEIDDDTILKKVRETALDTKDKRAHLQAADMIFKLKERYPAGKLKITAYNEELEALGEG